MKLIFPATVALLLAAPAFAKCLRENPGRLDRCRRKVMAHLCARSPFRRVLLGLAGALALGCAAQEPPALFRGADMKLGEKLIAANKCVACHQQKVGGDGSAIYRPAGRIKTPGLLIGMVEQCSNQLNLTLFPDEVTAIAAVLNRDHYKFK